MNKPYLLFFLAVFFTPEYLFAQQDVRYVRDILYITLRAAPDSSAEIVESGMRSGMAMTVIEESADGNYSLVETADGSRGWTQTQYLSDQPAARDLLEQARSRITTLEQERTQLTLRLEELEELTASYNRQQRELERVKSLSSNAVQLDQQNTRLRTENQALATQLASVTDENAQLKARMENSDFLNGAIAVVLGVLIAVIIPKLRPSRKSEWA